VFGGEQHGHDMLGNVRRLKLAQRLHSR